jgi:predicted permease
MFSNLFYRIRVLLRHGTVERQLDEELRFHLERQAEKYMDSRLSREEALRRARAEFGGVELAKEECRDARGVRLPEVIWQDVRYGVRLLCKSPGFAAVAVLTLALGIGANTAIFSLLNGLVLRDLPVPHAEQLVRFGVHSPDDDFTALSLPMFQEFSSRQNVFSQTFVWWGDAVVNAEVNGALSRADVWCVDGNFHSQLGAEVELGRLFDAEETKLSAAAGAQVAILGYGFWRNHYGSARDVIGKTIKIEGVPFTIIGVTRKRFTGISADIDLEVTLPLTAEPLIFGDPDVQKHLRRREVLWLEATGRLKPGMTLEQARVELESLWPGIHQEMAPLDKTPEELANFQRLQLKVEYGARGGSYARHRFEKPLYVLLAIAGVVLLLACVNLASMMLARAASRSNEMSVRVALGASRGRLALQMFTESVALSAMGALFGFVIAYWASHALSAFILAQIYIVPASLNLAPDWRILGFTGAAAILTGVLFGLAPAWRATREDPHATIQQTGHRLSSGTGRLGKSLIVAQIALSLVLLTASGLFIRTLLKLRFAHPGFRTQGLLASGLFPKPGAYKNAGRVNYYHELTDRV